MYGKRRMLLVSAGAARRGLGGLRAGLLRGPDDRRTRSAGPRAWAWSRWASACCVTCCRRSSSARSIALMSASMGIGGALGLPIAAAVAENASWRVLFWVAAALSLAGRRADLALRAREPGGRHAGHASTCSARSASASAWSPCCSPSPRAPTGAGRAAPRSACSPPPSSSCWPGAGGSCARAEPLVDLRVTARPQVLLTNAASIVVGFAMYAQSLVVPAAAPAARGHRLRPGPVDAGHGPVDGPGGPDDDGCSPRSAPSSRPPAARRSRCPSAPWSSPSATASSLLLMGSTVGPARRDHRLQHRRRPRLRRDARPDHGRGAAVRDRLRQQLQHADALDRHLRVGRRDRRGPRPDDHGLRRPFACRPRTASASPC